MTYLLEELNSRAVSAPELLVSEGDERYAREIARAAAAIRDHMKICPIVLISGPSGAGKTTTAKRIEEELEKWGINSHTISLDNYFKTLDPAACPRTEDGKIDYESPLLLDMDLLNEHFAALSRGEEIMVPYFDFPNQRRSAERAEPLRLKDNEIAIFEGIHALNDMITEKNPEAFTLYISPSAKTQFPDGEVFLPEWIRFVRRLVRDSNFRGAGADYTLDVWENVMAGERKYIAPFVEKAALKLESSLGYDMPALAGHAIALLRRIVKGDEYFEKAQELISLLEQFEEIPEKYVPADSLLREFIGGGVFKY